MRETMEKMEESRKMAEQRGLKLSSELKQKNYHALPLSYMHPRNALPLDIFVPISF